MELNSQWIEYPSGAETVAAYLSRPADVADPLPGIVVIQETWGPDEHIQDLARRFATAGYAVLVPDLYAHGGPRPAALAADRIEEVKAFLDTVPMAAWHDQGRVRAAVEQLPEPRRGRVAGTLGALFDPNRPMERFVGDLRAAVAYLRQHPACRGQRIGSTGYCMGGALSALLACTEPQLAAAVIYYGTSPAAERVRGISCPVLGLYGGDDPRITDGVPAFAEAMRAADKELDYRVYPGAPHAFFNDTRSSYRVDASRDAWARTLAFFARQLAPAT